LVEILEEVKSIHIIYTDKAPDVIEESKQLVKLYSFDELREIGKSNPVPPEAAPNSDSMAVIMYTSGTTVCLKVS